MTAAFTIRQAREADMRELVELLGLLFGIESDFAPDAARQRAGLSLLLGKGAGLVLAATARSGQPQDAPVADCDPERVVGMATAQVVVSTAEGGPALLVEDVVVRPQWRGRGVGRALLSRIEAWGIGLGATRLQLLADRHNTASHAFYASCGYASTNLVCLRRVLPAAGK
ncbi:Ribosomal protein S18 acetylase RimI [Humidesulfovibrio mexicanus]|uniref:Ribosomal protein S18 acetylase RimI n=1 Tax=Humidesulfovibrio mexicanus TaxID=147047 RepID=A0A239B2N7_9BACT|nr:GNAT family N-acetyltransferase [Humidesulfovibrio mexicanus]SNS02117.1 Ribosomal protein S18 acetylase RimI [Humidesulfovibrio mexicanus]